MDSGLRQNDVVVILRLVGRSLTAKLGGAMQALQCITFATAIAVGVALAAAPVYAQAQQNPSTSSGRGFPSKPVRVIVPNPAGSQGDTLARMVAQKLSEIW